ncbi:MAG TPA: hypothetical protein VLV56_09185 [Burkholderiales bacterium]|nr:hypothetical protein [Burkholderiales bacterium]
MPDPTPPGRGSAGQDAAAKGQPLVRDFRQIVLWPVQLMPRREGAQIQKHWELLERTGIDSVWKEVADEFTADPAQFGERHYREFVTFLPYVQRFLYGEGDAGGYGGSPIRVFRRADVAQVRITFPEDPEPMLFGVAHVDLCFFYDIDIAILVVEIFAKDITLSRALDTLYRFGRAYPTHWEPSGRGGHCAERVEWISREGRVLAASDYEKRERFLSFVCQHRVPCVAFHWEYLLWPLVLHHSDRPGAVRYREIEYQRMPLMSYLAFDDVTRLTRGDWVRLGLVTRPGDPETLPYSERFLQDFEYRYCYDRYWDQTRPHDWMNTRFICNGHAFTVIGSAGEPFFTDAESGILGQFRHQLFLLGLIAHFHKASLLMLADRLVVAISRLDIRRSESIRVFKRSIRQTMEIFLRFTHRYWFHAVSDQAQAADLFTIWSRHLRTDALYEEARQEIQDMTHYLDSDQVRRQAETVVRLTVVTILGLVVNIATGYFGMNLIAAADNPLPTKIAYFLLVFIPALAFILYAVAKSKALSDFLDAMSDERLGSRQKLGVLFSVWRRRRAELDRGRNSGE